MHLQTRAHSVRNTAPVCHTPARTPRANAVQAIACRVRLNLEEVNCQLDTWNGREKHRGALARLEARTLLRAEHFIPPTKVLLSG